MSAVGQRFRRLARRVPLVTTVRRTLDWRRRDRLFRQLIARMPAAPSVSAEAPIAIVVQPWMLSDVPWYTLLLAFAIRQRGRRVVIIRDDLVWDNGWAADRMVNASIDRAVRLIGDRWDVRRFSEAEQGHAHGVPADEIATLAHLNLKWHHKGDAWPSGAHRTKAALESHFGRVASAVTALLQDVAPGAIVVPGGIFSSSGVIRTVAERLRIRVATFDSGPGVMLTSCNGVAAWLSDIPRAVREIGTADEAMVREWAGQELAGRRGQPGGRSVFGDTYRAQAEVKAQGDVIIPLNQSFDTAALGRHCVFSSQVELMVETVRWVLANSEATVVVRRHPVERLEGMRSSEEYGEILRREFGDTPRVRYVAEVEAVSTYDLLASARLVVPYTSTVGVESAIYGVPVVTESKSYYSESGFVWAARTRAEFDTLLRRGLSGELVVSEAARADALRVYYATQLCNFCFTSITPADGDFAKWVTQDPAALLASPELTDIVTGLVEDVPLPVLRHRRRVAAR